MCGWQVKGGVASTTRVVVPSNVAAAAVAPKYETIKVIHCV